MHVCIYVTRVLAPKYILHICTLAKALSAVLAYGKAEQRMVARATDLVEHGLRSGDREARLRALREIKNQIIGNKAKKASYLHVIPTLLDVLATDSADSDLLVQSAAAIGSFSYGIEEGVKSIVANGGINHLINCLSSPDANVVEAAARSLKLIYQVFVATSMHRVEHSVHFHHACIQIRKLVPAPGSHLSALSSC